MSLSSIQVIEHIRPHFNADRLEIATVLGWECIVKKGEFSVGEKVIFFKVDSFLPKGSCNDELCSTYIDLSINQITGTSGYRIKTIRLRGEYSQGLITKINLFNIDYSNLEVGDSLDQLLGVEKWESIEITTGGQPVGKFPSYIPKTDVKNIQDLLKFEYNSLFSTGTYWLKTEKLDGMSCTMYYMNGEFGVASKDLPRKETASDIFWIIARRYQKYITGFSIKMNTNLAFQGEIIGKDSRNNPYNLKDNEFYLYSIWDIDKKRYIPLRVYMIWANFLKSVPLLDLIRFDQPPSINQFLSEVEGKKSILNNNIDIEGYVYHVQDGTGRKFKVKSRKRLLKAEND